MRVVYFVSLFPCWSETFIVREMKALADLGVEIRIVSLKHPSESLVQDEARALLGQVDYPVRGSAGAWRAAAEALRRPLRTLADLATIVSGLWRRPVELAKTLAVFGRTLALLPQLRRWRPDRLHAHWATYPSTAAMLASHRLGVPFSFTSHAHDIFRHDQLLTSKLNASAFAVTISEFNRRFLAERLPAAATSRLRVIHCGVPTDRLPFQPAGREPRLIVAVGRLDPIKGFEHLVDACELLRRQGATFNCRVIGDGPLRAALQARIADAGLADLVVLLGALPQPQVQHWLQRAAVFVLPSVVTRDGDRDGIPVALMEAMATGVPVVSTTVSGIPELVEHERSGLLAPPADATALAACMRRVLDDPAAAAARAATARQVVERHFDARREAHKLYEAFA